MGITKKRYIDIAGKLVDKKRSDEKILRRNSDRCLFSPISFLFDGGGNVTNALCLALFNINPTRFICHLFPYCLCVKRHLLEAGLNCLSVEFIRGEPL